MRAQVTHVCVARAPAPHNPSGFDPENFQEFIIVGLPSSAVLPSWRRYCVYLKLLMYMYRVGPIVAVPPQDELFVPQILNRK